MSSIKSDFLKHKSKHKNLSDLLNFTNVIKSKKYPLIKLIRNFNELVDKNEYDNKDSEMLYRDFLRMTNLP
ncbi:MAG: hypothetical protein WCO35_02645 [Candidatus Nomurabacteria bacterium]